MNGRLPVLNLWVDPVDMPGALACVAEFVETGNRVHSIFAVNPEKNFSVPTDPILYKAFQQADLLIPDGIGVVLAARLLYGIRLSRVPGVELMENLCRLAAGRNYGVFLYGAREEVNHAAALELTRRYPGLRIAGRSHGYVNEADMSELVRRINASGARILFLALGSPKQERWLATWGPSLTTVRVCQGVGGTLDTIAGTVRRAPIFWCNMGLEWFYRLMTEPSRWRRQLALPRFLFELFKAKAHSREHGKPRNHFC